MTLLSTYMLFPSNHSSTRISNNLNNDCPNITVMAYLSSLISRASHSMAPPYENPTSMANIPTTIITLMMSHYLLSIYIYM